MEYLTIKEQEVLAKLKGLYPHGVNFNLVTKAYVSRQLNINTGNFFRTFKNLAKKGHIKYEDNCITYN